MTKKKHPVAVKLLADIQDYRERFGVDRTRFGIEAAGDGHFIRRIELGRIPRLTTIDQVYRYMERKTKAVMSPFVTTLERTNGIK